MSSQDLGYYSRCLFPSSYNASYGGIKLKISNILSPEDKLKVLEKNYMELYKSCEYKWLKSMIIAIISTLIVVVIFTFLIKTYIRVLIKYQSSPK